MHPRDEITEDDKGGFPYVVNLNEVLGGGEFGAVPLAQADACWKFFSERGAHFMFNRREVAFVDKKEAALCRMGLWVLKDGESPYPFVSR